MQKTYACTRCGQVKSRDQLMVKKAVFLTMGEGGRTIRSRVTEWLCGTCAADDPDWNREFNRGQFPDHPIRHHLLPDPVVPTNG